MVKLDSELATAQSAQLRLQEQKRVHEEQNAEMLAKVLQLGTHLAGLEERKKALEVELRDIQQRKLANGRQPQPMLGARKKQKQR